MSSRKKTRRTRKTNYDQELRERLDLVFQGMSAREVATLCGVAFESGRRYLHGSSLPEVRVLARICEQRGISADWLLLGHQQRRGREPVKIDLDTVPLPELLEHTAKRLRARPVQNAVRTAARRRA